MPDCAELRTANLALERAMAELARSSAAVQRSLDIHNRLTAASSAGEGQDGIARAVHELTGLPVAIEDRHGDSRASTIARGGCRHGTTTRLHKFSHRIDASVIISCYDMK